MAEPFIAEVRIWALNFAPRGFAFCNGELLPIAEHTAMFSLMGTTYGGDGRTTFAVPNLQGRTPIHPGRGPGLTPIVLGQFGGVPTVTLTESKIPTHDHVLQGDDRVPETATPGTDKMIGNYFGENAYHEDTSPSPQNLVSMSSAAIGYNGGGQSHENRQPFLALNFTISQIGTYPSRN